MWIYNLTFIHPAGAAKWYLGLHFSNKVLFPSDSKLISTALLPNPTAGMDTPSVQLHAIVRSSASFEIEAKHINLEKNAIVKRFNSKRVEQVAIAWWTKFKTQGRLSHFYICFPSPFPAPGSRNGSNSSPDSRTLEPPAWEVDHQCVYSHAF